MNWKAWAPLSVALVFGLVAAFVGMKMMSFGPKGPNPNDNMSAVVVATGNVEVGAVLKDTDLTTGKLPTASLPAGKFDKTSDLVGRVVNTPLVKGQLVLETMLTPPDTGSGLTAIIPQGMRAATVDVNDTSGLCGMLTPGCHVDVVCTFGGDSSRTVMENLKIIAVGRRFGTAAPDPDPNAPPVRQITLLVTPRQATAIELACRIGAPQMLLRGSGDSTLAGNATVTAFEIRGTPAPVGDKISNVSNVQPATMPVDITPRAPRADAGYRIIQIIRGGSESSVRIEVSSPPSVADTKDNGN